MLNKDAEVRCTPTTRESFTRIKNDFGEAPVLVSLDYQKPFQVFSFTSPSIIAVVLLQKNQDNKEKAITFFSEVLRDVELKFNVLEKQSYILVKALKAFRMYIL